MTDWHRALVTGASSGIGEAYVRALASRCTQILVVARREERLRALAADLADRCSIEVLPADLAGSEGQARVVEAIRQGPALDLLINNAGFSTLGPFADSVLDDELRMLRLHQEATLALTRAAVPAMQAQGRGAIINVASIGGFLKLPGVATYAASKAFLVSFSRSLQAELADSGLRVQCLCPGYTRTEIHSSETFRGFDVERVPEALWMDSDEVVRASLAALECEGENAPQQWLLVPGAHNRSVVQRSLHELIGEQSTD